MSLLFALENGLRQIRGQEGQWQETANVPLVQSGICSDRPLIIGTSVQDAILQNDDEMISNSCVKQGHEIIRA